MEDNPIRFEGNRRNGFILIASMFLGIVTSFGSSWLAENILSSSSQSQRTSNGPEGTSVVPKNDRAHRWLDTELEYGAILLESDFPAFLRAVRTDAEKGDSYAHYVLGALHALQSEGTAPDEGLDGPDPKALAILHYTVAAEAGDLNAALALAYRYERGYGVRVNCTRSAELYGRVAKAIVDVAVDEPILPLTQMLVIGDDPEQSPTVEEKTAGLLQYGEFQASQGSGKFHLAVGYTYLFGILGQKQNGVNAENHFTQALRQGHSAAYGALGQLYAKGAPGVQKNTTAAFEYFLAGGREGDVSSLNGLATFFAKGITVERNVTRAVQYYKLAAFHGNPEAHYNLGVIYLNGADDTLDVENAKHHLSLASEKGMHLARYRLGTLYEKGIGVVQSCAKAVDLYKTVLKEGPRERRLARANTFYGKGKHEAALFFYLLSAENGQAQAELNLGVLLEKHGEELKNVVMPSFPFAALRYYQRSGAQGTKSALTNAGDMLYAEGLHTKRCNASSSTTDPKCAFYQQLIKIAPRADLHSWAAQYYREAEIKRSAYAAYCLGWMHHFGSMSVEQDDGLAEEYYRSAMEYNSRNTVLIKALLVLLKYGELPVIRQIRQINHFVANCKWSINIQIHFSDVLIFVIICFLSLLLFVRSRITNV